MLAFSAFSGYILWSSAQRGATIAEEKVPALNGPNPPNYHAVVQYVVSEEAGFLVAKLEWFDIFAGLALTVALLVGTHIHRMAGVVAAIMVLATVFLHFVVGPEIAYFGRDLAGNSAARARLLALEGAYFVVLAAKILLGAGLAIYLLAIKTRVRRAPVGNVDMIDHADHRHINR